MHASQDGCTCKDQSHPFAVSRVYPQMLPCKPQDWVHAAGSMNMSYDSSNLTTPDIKWLGVRPSDLDRFNLPQQCLLPMTDEDIQPGKRLVCSSP